MVRKLSGWLHEAEQAEALARLRGLEGMATRLWYRFLGSRLRSPWRFERRTRRPPRDPFNALLSLGYTWLTNRAVAATQARGLEVYLGSLHAYRPGRPSLACDLTEPFRVPMVDRWALSVCNRGVVSPEDFRADSKAAVRWTSSAGARIMASWEEHFESCQGWQKLNELVDQYVARLKALLPTPLRGSKRRGAWAECLSAGLVETCGELV